MSVIAKLYIQDTRNYGSGALTLLNCVCDNDMMAAYAESEEDKLFTRYSPSGDVKLHHESGWTPLGEPQEKFYFMIVRDDEVEDHTFPGAKAFRRLQVYSVTDFGHDSKKLEFRDVTLANEPHPATDHRAKIISKFSWHMTIDNPPLMESGFLKPGGTNFWLVIYPADKFTRDQAIAASHGFTPPTKDDSASQPAEQNPEPVD